MTNIAERSIPSLETTISDPIAVRLFNLEQRNEQLERQNVDLIAAQERFGVCEDGVPYMGDPDAPRLPYRRFIKRGKLLPGAGYMFAGWWQLMKDRYAKKAVK